MNEHITKPIDPELLYRTVQQFLESSMKSQAPAQESREEIKVAGLDAVQGLERVGGNRRLYLKLLNDFARDFREVAEKLASATPAEARGLAHSLKGAASNLGAVELAESSEQVEKAAREEHDFAAYLPELKERMESLVAAVLELKVEDSPDQESGDDMGDEQLREIIDRCLSWAKEGDIRVEEELPKIERSLRNRGFGEEFEVARSGVESFDFDQAVVALEGLRQKV